jgi:hypothetical protein
MGTNRFFEGLTIRVSKPPRVKAKMDIYLDKRQKPSIITR